MSRNYFDRDTPIVALATPEGRSALAIIRTSGEAAIDIVARCFSRPEALLGAAGYQAVHGWIIDPLSNERIDEVMALVYKAPHSFTGENAVEILCHGSAAVVRRILDLLYMQGFSPALQGEFSFRAFIEGKTDLVRAEAINELSLAFCEAARHDALSRLSGVLSKRLKELRSMMLDVLADIDARLDYSEDEGPEEIEHWPMIISQVQDALAELLKSYPGGKLRQEGLLVVIAGRPNAGKSSLFNLLVREERAIVSEEPGTTRDWLESWITIGGLAVRLVDTAGLRDSKNEIEIEGVRRAKAMLDKADVILYLVDGTAGLYEEDKNFMAAYPGALFLWNKVDRMDCLSAPAGWKAISAKDVASFGFLESVLVDELRAKIDKGYIPQSSEPQYQKSESGEPQNQELQVRIASERQKQLLSEAQEALNRAMEAYEAGVALDLVSLHIQEAAESIGEITGDIVSDEVLERIFSCFCLGK